MKTRGAPALPPPSVVSSHPPRWPCGGTPKKRGQREEAALAGPVRGPGTEQGSPAVLPAGRLGDVGPGGPVRFSPPSVTLSGPLPDLPPGPGWPLAGVTWELEGRVGERGGGAPAGGPHTAPSWLRPPGGATVLLAPEPGPARSSEPCAPRPGRSPPSRRPRAVHAHEHTRDCRAASRVPSRGGAISALPAPASGTSTALTVTQTPEPKGLRAGEEQRGSCFLLGQVCFSSQLCLTKMSLC